MEALALAYIETGLTQLGPRPVAASNEELANDPALLALVTRIKAMPPNSASIIPAKGKLADLLAVMVQGEPDLELLAALDVAELEQRALDRADELAEGRG